MVVFGGGVKCAKCDKSVYVAEEVKALNKSFHKTCFTCAKCEKVLALGKYSVKDNEIPYCEPCYKQVFAPPGPSAPKGVSPEPSPRGLAAPTTAAGAPASPRPDQKALAVPKTGGYNAGGSTTLRAPSPSASSRALSPAAQKPPPSPRSPSPVGGVSVASGTDEAKVRKWIEAVSGEQCTGDLQTWLKDGQVLCRVANKVAPGTIAKINPAGMPFKEMENVTAFSKACKAWGVLEKDTFSTVDLYENKNMKAVFICMMNLDGVLRAKGIGDLSHAPQIGVSQRSAVEDVARGKVAVTQASGYRADIDKEVKQGMSGVRGGAR